MSYRVASSTNMTNKSVTRESTQFTINEVKVYVGCVLQYMYRAFYYIVTMNSYYYHNSFLIDNLNLYDLF